MGALRTLVVEAIQVVRKTLERRHVLDQAVFTLNTVTQAPVAFRTLATLRTLTALRSRVTLSTFATLHYLRVALEEFAVSRDVRSNVDRDRGAVDAEGTQTYGIGPKVDPIGSTESRPTSSLHDVLCEAIVVGDRVEVFLIDLDGGRPLEGRVTWIAGTAFNLGGFDPTKAQHCSAQRGAQHRDSQDTEVVASFLSSNAPVSAIDDGERKLQLTHPRRVKCLHVFTLNR